MFTEAHGNSFNLYQIYQCVFKKKVNNLKGVVKIVATRLYNHKESAIVSQMNVKLVTTM